MSLTNSPAASVRSSSSSIADIIDGSVRTPSPSRRNSLRRTLTSINSASSNNKLTEALKNAEILNNDDNDHLDKFRIGLQKIMSTTTFGAWIDN